MSTEEYRSLLRDRIASLSVAWIQLEQQGGAVDRVLKELHTIKGEAAVLGFASAAEVAHAVEELLVDVVDVATLDDDQLDLILEGFDVLDEAVADAQGDCSEFLGRVNQWRADSGPAEQQMPRYDSPTAPVPSPPPPRPTIIMGSEAGELPKPREPAPSGEDKSVVVTTGQLDRMTDLISELLHTRALLQTSLRDLIGTTASVNRKLGDSDDGRHLERVGQRIRDDLYGSSNLIDGLEELSRSMRMVPLRTLVDRVPRVVRQLSRDLKKPAQCLVEGADGFLDRAIRDSLNEPLLHLVRNAMDHGLEGPGERSLVGKDEAGTIRVQSQIIGNTLHLRVTDDGGGINLDSVRKRAESLGLVGANTDPTPEQLLALLFAPRMSTRQEISQVSGRGVGLSVVRETITLLGGEVRIEDTAVGRGTTFLLTVPVTTTIATVLLFEVEQRSYALQSSAVVSVNLASDFEHVETLDGPAIRFREGLAPVLWLPSLLEGESESPTEQDPSERIIIVRSGTQIVALRGSRRHSLREAVVRPISYSEDGHRLVYAGVGLEDGKVALVLDSHGLLGWRVDGSALAATVEREQLVLIVDDSPIIRTMLKEALGPLELSIVEAEDGQRALELIGSGLSVDLLITDLEMPRVDGFELVSRLRAMDMDRRIPALVVSSRGSDEDKLAAIEAGADSYIVKTEFSADGLRTVVRRYLGD